MRTTYLFTAAEGVQMTPDRCPDCGVLSGSVHHVCCGFQHELSPDGKLVRVVRMSPRPCEICGEFYELLHHNQKHHKQSVECFSHKKRDFHRVRDSRRAAERARKRAQREAETAVFRHVEKPFALALCMSKKHYLWLRKMDNADYEQTLYLALLDAQINPFEPAYIDINRLHNFVRRHMERLQCNCGFRRVRQRDNTRPLPHFVESDIANMPPRNWFATWFSA